MENPVPFPAGFHPESQEEAPASAQAWLPAALPILRVGRTWQPSRETAGASSSSPPRRGGQQGRVRPACRRGGEAAATLWAGSPLPRVQSLGCAVNSGDR